MKKQGPSKKICKKRSTRGFSCRLGWGFFVVFSQNNTAVTSFSTRYFSYVSCPSVLIGQSTRERWEGGLLRVANTASRRLTGRKSQREQTATQINTELYAGNEAAASTIKRADLTDPTLHFARLGQAAKQRKHGASCLQI